jgi:hypothetical protein
VAKTVPFRSRIGGFPQRTRDEMSVDVDGSHESILPNTANSTTKAESIRSLVAVVNGVTYHSDSHLKEMP